MTAPAVRRHRATNAYAFKRALFDQLRARTLQPGNALTGVQVAYSWPGSMPEAVCVYGGGVLFDRPEDEDISDGQDVLPYERATIGVHVRTAVVSTADVDPVQDSDARAEAILDEIDDFVRSNPAFFGPNTFCHVSGGQGDYTPVDSASASLVGVRVLVDSYVT